MLESLTEHWSSLVIGGLLGIVCGQQKFIKAQRLWINFLNNKLFEAWKKKG